MGFLLTLISTANFETFLRNLFWRPEYVSNIAKRCIFFWSIKIVWIECCWKRPKRFNHFPSSFFFADLNCHLGQMPYKEWLNFLQVWKIIWRMIYLASLSLAELNLARLSATQRNSVQLSATKKVIRKLSHLALSWRKSAWLWMCSAL